MIKVKKNLFSFIEVWSLRFPGKFFPGKGMVVYQPIEDFRQLIYLVILCLYYIISYYIVSLYE